MPILLSCPFCSSKMKAPDHLAGKKAKCPKCGKAAPVPANGAAPTISAATKPKAAEPPAPTRAAAKPAMPTPDKSTAKEPSLPLQSFDKLKIGGRFRALIEKEINTEEIVWMGRPDPKERMKKAWIGSIIGAVFTLFSPLSFLVLLADAPPDKEWIKLAIALGIFAVVLLLFGLPMLFMPLLVRIFINYRPVYVLTNRRAVVAENRFGFSAKFYSFDRAKLLTDMEVMVGENGLGSVIMGYELLEMEGPMRHKSTTRTSEDGSRKSTTSTMGRARGHTAKVPLGFLDVEDVSAVEALVRRTLNVPAKKTESDDDEDEDDDDE